MPFIDTPNGVRVAMNYQCEGQQCANIFHVSADDPGDPATLDSIGATFKTWWKNEVQAFQHSACLLLNVTAVDISTSGGAFSIYTTALPDAGTNSNPSLTNSVTVTTTLTTGFTGRSFRGRFYWLGLTADDLLDVNHFKLTSTAALTNAAKALIIAAASNGTPLCVLSLQLNKVPRTSGVLTRITNAKTDNTVDAQRRRLPGRGL